MGKVKVLLWVSILLIFTSESMVLSGFLTDSMLLKLVQYFVAIVPLFICMLQLFLKTIENKNNIKYLFELKRVVILFFVFAGISFYKIYRNRVFTMMTIQELVQLMLPFMFCFVVINILNKKEITYLMELGLVIFILGYLYQTGLSTFTLENILSVSFLDSYSPFENSDFAEIASALSIYFIYNRKENPVGCIFSLIFSFLVFKRVFLLMTIVLLVVSLININDLYFKPNVKIFLGVGITGTVLVTYYLFQPENAMLFKSLFGTDVGDFTMGRVYRLWYKLGDFKSYGFGSTSAFLGYNLELDLIKIYMELGIVSLLYFVYCYFSLTHDNLYAVMTVSMSMLNLLFASGLVMYVGWMIKIIAIGTICYIDNNNHLDEHKFKRIRIRI